jgi:recombination associated protein RdgC
VVSEGSEAAPQNDEERFDADTIMMTGELAGLIDDLIEGLGGVAE